MISVNLVTQTLLMFADTDVRGNATPTKRGLAIHQAVNEIYESYFLEINRYLNRQNRGLVGNGLENMVSLFNEKIQHFLVEEATLTYADPHWNLPADHRFTDVITCDGSEVEFYSNNDEFRAVTNCVDTAPTIKYPIGLKLGNKVKIAPSTDESEVKATYLRNPVMAKWTYQVISGAEVFNPSASDFRDIDLHQSEFHNVVLKTLTNLGVNLKEQDIVAFTQNKGVQEFNQDNTL